jgi:hypothetical protein
MTQKNDQDNKSWSQRITLAGCFSSVESCRSYPVVISLLPPLTVTVPAGAIRAKQIN